MAGCTGTAAVQLQAGQRPYGHQDQLDSDSGSDNDDYSEYQFGGCKTLTGRTSLLPASVLVMSGDPWWVTSEAKLRELLAKCMELKVG